MFLVYLQLLAAAGSLKPVIFCLEVMVEVPVEDLVEVKTTMGSKKFINSLICLDPFIRCTIFATFPLQLDLSTDTC